MNNWCRTVFLCAFLAESVQISAAQQHDWENPHIIGVNKEPYHATLTLPSKIKDCTEVTCLDGYWKFHWSKDPDGAVPDFSGQDFDASGWDSIVVPGEWQLQGYGKPIYSNFNYPFKANAPYVMDEPGRDYYSYEHRNPVGQYITTFWISADDLKDKALYLQFGGVESAFYLWINGQMVGYSQNSMAPAEFNITDYVVEGSNRLAVQVFQWSDGSYLEDQDMWRLSGIFRSVYLWKRPAVHIADYNITTDMDTVSNQTTVNLKVVLRNTSARNVSKLTVSATIAHGTNLSDKTVPMKMQLKKLAAGTTDTLYLSGVISDPLLWSPEKPNLYDIELELSGKALSEPERFSNHFGVRTIERSGEVFLFNGKPVKLKGVNRHEFHPRLGRTPDENTYRLDLSLMKRANINMIRTSHYPDDPLFYELCDEYGFYVMDEANQESHQYGIGNTFLGDNPDWTDAHVDRALAVVMRDFNHPCVIIWSLGNEGGRGRNFKAMAHAVRSIDSTRLVFSDSDRSVSDLYDDSYLSPERSAQTAARISDRPFFMREYYYQEGNSGGNLDEYWHYIYADSSYLGGAIWEWASHGLAAKKDGGVLEWDNNPKRLELDSDEYFAYGGDFGDMPNDATDCINGLVSADRTPKPSYYQVQYVYQDLKFEYSATRNAVKVMNANYFTVLSEYDYTYAYCCNGNIIKSGNVSLNNSNELILPGVDMNGAGSEYTLEITARLRNPIVDCLKNQVVAREQFILKEWKAPEFESDVKVLYSCTGSVYSVVAGDNTFVIDRTNGSLSSWKANGTELLAKPLEPYFWKTATDVQTANNYLTRLGLWKNQSDERKVTLTSAKFIGNILTVTVNMELGVGASYVLTYSFANNGKVMVNASYVPESDNIAQMPKFGVRMGIDSVYSNISWYGRGPWENYPDRKSGYFIGSYKSSLEDFVTEYIHPQDNANRTDVRYFVLTSADNHSLIVEGMQPLCFRAWPYTEQQLEEAGHPYQIGHCGYVNLNVDLNIHGVGGNDGWGSRTAAEYTLPGNSGYSYSFTMEYR
ncbi:MAG: DUF4981 domain-containing protein [Bacteroidaceae bacterium]|nr:DUF4981 domain-containing protein [Bacteroidaceae bacterium]